MFAMRNTSRPASIHSSPRSNMRNFVNGPEFSLAGHPSLKQWKKIFPSRG